MSDNSGNRAFTRIPVHIQVEIQPEGGELLRGTVHDLSFNGVSVDVEGTPVAEGTECEVELILDGGIEELRLPGHGQVVRASPGLVAVSFSSLDGDVYEHFERLVLMNARDPGAVEAELREHEDDQPVLRDPLHD
jgi:hypothetical protein